jgi:hypothetical protein
MITISPSHNVLSLDGGQTIRWGIILLMSECRTSERSEECIVRNE